MTLATTARAIDRLAQQLLPSHEQPTRVIESEIIHIITRRTTLNDDQLIYKVFVSLDSVQFAITGDQNYACVQIPRNASEAAITRFIIRTRDDYTRQLDHASRDTI